MPIKSEGPLTANGRSETDASQVIVVACVLSVNDRNEPAGEAQQVKTRAN
jgi:hypothetical protein